MRAIQMQLSSNHKHPYRCLAGRLQVVRSYRQISASVYKTIESEAYLPNGTRHLIGSSWTSGQLARHSCSGCWCPGTVYELTIKHKKTGRHTWRLLFITTTASLSFSCILLVSLMTCFTSAKHTTLVMIRESRRFCWCSWGLSYRQVRQSTIGII